MTASPRNAVAQAAEDNISCLSDTDNCYEESFGSWISEPQSLIINWRGWKRGNDGNGTTSDSGSSATCGLITGLNSKHFHQYHHQETFASSDSSLLSLVELAAQAVAKHIPFEVVETVRPPVPEQLHLRIAFWSFPDNEEDVRMYACLANGSADLFIRAEELLRKRAVRDMLQIGFHLSASVCSDSSASGGSGSVFTSRQVHEVALTFDRKKIITCNCTCAHSSWCPHIIAVCLQRILHPEEVILRAPISESLSRLQRDQLQKFAQYLISELPKQILPTAQKLLDDLLDGQQSRINSLRGAPDPTAGASINEKTNWFLDVSVLHENIRKILLKLCIPSTSQPPDGTNPCLAPPIASSEWQTLLGPLRGKQPEGIWNLMAIVREMMKRGDSNAVSLLRIVTQEIMDCSQIINWWFNVKSNLGNSSFSGLHSNNRSSLQTSLTSAQHACASLCEEIVALWRLACLNPRLDAEERDEYFELLKNWHVKVLDTSNHSSDRNDSNYDKYLGFKPALEACYIDWTNFPIPGLTIPAKLNSTSIDDTLKQLTEEDNVGAIGGEMYDKIQLKVQHKAAVVSSFIDDATAVEMLSNLSIESKQMEDTNSLNESLDSGDFVLFPEQYINQNNQPVLADDEDNDDELSSNNHLSDAKKEDISNNDSPSVVDFNNEQDKQLNALYKFSFNANTNIKYVCNSLSNEKTYTITVHKANDLYEIDFARAEALYAHGFTRQAMKYAIRLAEHLLQNPPQMSFDLEQLIPIRPKKSKSRYNPILRQQSLQVSALYTKITFLCRALCEDPTHYDLAFQIGLLGLQLPRPPAPIKSLEAKLHNQEKELFIQMKEIPLKCKQIAILRQKAAELRDGRLPARGAVLPLTLAHYIFNTLVLNTSANTTEASLRSDPMLMIVQDRFSSDEQLAFAATVNVLGMKCIIPEVDYPLLCEGIRSQRKELSMCLLTHYKDNESRLVKIMEKLLDRSSYRKTNFCFMNCPGPCICQSAYSCPSCVQIVEQHTNVQREYSWKKQGEFGVVSSGNADTFTSDQRVNSLFVSSNMSKQMHQMTSACQLSESPSASANYLYPSEDPFSVDPYKEWDHAQPAEQRANGFAFDTSSNSTEGILNIGAKGGNWRGSSCSNSPSNNHDGVTGSVAEASLLDRSTTSGGSSSMTNESNDLIIAGHNNAPEEAHLYEEPIKEDNLEGSPTRLDQLASCLSCACLIQQSKNLDKYSPLSNFSSLNSNISPGLLQHNFPGNLLMFNPTSTNFNQMVNRRNNSMGNSNKIRFKDQRSKVCMNICQTTKAAAYFACDLAQALLKEAGGTNEGHAQFQISSSGEGQINKLLHFCAFQLGLYSLGLNNSTLSTWYMRTYSGHSSWVTNQAIEIGPSAINFLITTWRGHLTPSEVAALADRASRGYSPQMARTASRLVLSCLLHASALSQNEIHRAVLQCKEQSEETLMKALDFLEYTARQGGISFEMLFEVARRWADLADSAKAKATKRKKKNSDAGCASVNNPITPSMVGNVLSMSGSTLSVNGVVASHFGKVSSNIGPVATSSSPSPALPASLHAPRPAMVPQSIVSVGPVGSSSMIMGMYMNPHHLHHNHQPNFRSPYTSFAPSIASAQHMQTSGGSNSSLLPTPPTQSNVSQLASVNGIHSTTPARLMPNAPGHFNMPFWPWSATGAGPATAQMLPSQSSHPTASRPFSINNFPSTGTWPIPHHSAPHHHHPASMNAQMMPSTHPPPGSTATPITVQIQPGQSLPIHGIQMQNARFDPNTGQLLIPAGNSYIHTSTMAAGIAAIIPDGQLLQSNGNSLTGQQHHHHSMSINRSPFVHPQPLHPPQPQSATHDNNHDNRLLKPFDAYQSYLLKAYQVGLLAMDRLCKRVQDEKPRNRFARFTPYGDDVKWLFSICKKLGLDFIQEFCTCACSCIQSPFVLHEIIDLACEALRGHYQLPDLQIYALPMLKPLIQKCQHMYMAYLYYQIHRISHHNEHESFCHGIVHAKIVFDMEPNGKKRFIEQLVYMKRHNTNLKSLWEKVFHFFPADHIINTDPSFRVA